MSRFKALVVISGLLTCHASWAASISGTYVGETTNAPYLLQLVQAADGRVAGRFERVGSVNGKIEVHTASVNGNVDGETIVLELKPTELISPTIVMSGTVQGDVLNLSGGGYGTKVNLTLKKSVESEYNAQVVALTNQVAQANAVRILEAEANAADDLLNKLNTFLKAPEPKPEQFKPYEARFRELTTQMRIALSKEQSIFRSDRTAVIRGQIDVAINQGNVEAKELYTLIQTKRDEFETTALSNTNKIAELTSRCADQSRRSIASTVQARWDFLCKTASSSARDFKATIAQMRASYARLIVVAEDELRNQQTILSYSAQASR